MDDIFSYLWILLLLLGLPVLTLMGIACLFRCEGEERRRMLWAAAVFLGALVLLVGGYFMLGCFGLIWRAVPTGVFLGVMLVSDWVWGAFTMSHILYGEWRGMPPALRWTLKGMIAMFAGLALLVSLFWWIIVCALIGDDSQRKIEYRGQPLVEISDGFLDPHYSYYAYHGPLVRGTEPVYEGPSRIDGGTRKN